jgi:hypothetical protein
MRYHQQLMKRKGSLNSKLVFYKHPLQENIAPLL